MSQANAYTWTQTTSSFTRFVLFSQPRTGSRMLSTALNSHPQIYCPGEIFNADVPREFPRRCSRESFGSAFDLLDCVWSKTRYRASGFVLHDDVYRSIQPPDPHNALSAYSAPFLGIWLSRRDKLAQYVSLQIARLTGAWSYRRGRLPRKLTPIRIDVADMRGWHARLQRSRNNRRRILERIPLHSITYEELQNDFTATVKQICSVLNVADQPLMPTTFKRSVQPLERVVQNYAEARKAMDRLVAQAIDP